MSITYHKPFDGNDGKWYVVEDRSEEGKSCRAIEFPSEQSAREFYETKQKGSMDK